MPWSGTPTAQKVWDPSKDRYFLFATPAHSPVKVQSNHPKTPRTVGSKTPTLGYWGARPVGGAGYGEVLYISSMHRN